VVKQDSTSTWFDSFAYGNGIEEGGEFWPLDDEMGAGHLNAKRALQQFVPGQWDYDDGDIPHIGWDYNTITGTGTTNVNRYQFAEELEEGHFISITLAWDRLVEFDNDGGTPTSLILVTLSNHTKKRMLPTYSTISIST